MMKTFAAFVYAVIYIPTYIYVSICLGPADYSWLKRLSTAEYIFNVILLLYFPIIAFLYMWWGIKFKYDIEQKMLTATLLWFGGWLLLLIALGIAFSRIPNFGLD